MKTTTCIALAFALAVMFMTGCGGGEYQAPPKGNDRPAGGGGTGGDTGGSGPGKKAPTGPSMMKEYTKEMNAAFDAHDDYEAVKRDTEARKEPYIVWAEHMYAALAFANIHERNGHDKEDLPRFKDLKELKGGYFKNALGPSDDPRVKAAMKNWQDSTN